MIKKKSIKTKFGWITAFESEGKIFKIKFGKEKKQTNSKVLVKLLRNLQKFSYIEIHLRMHHVPAKNVP